MSAPSNKAERLCAMCDSFCKTVIRNASRNLKRTRANRQKHVTAGSEQIQYLFDLHSHTDTYPSEQLVIHAGKLTCVVFNETLYEAMLSLPEQQRTVLILDFWYGWPDERISKYMEVTTRTVYNLRQRAFKTIRSFYEKAKTET